MVRNETTLSAIFSNQQVSSAIIYSITEITGIQSLNQNIKSLMVNCKCLCWCNYLSMLQFCCKFNHICKMAPDIAWSAAIKNSQMVNIDLVTMETILKGLIFNHHNITWHAHITMPGYINEHFSDKKNLKVNYLSEQRNTYCAAGCIHNMQHSFFSPAWNLFDRLTLAKIYRRAWQDREKYWCMSTCVRYQL